MLSKLFDIGGEVVTHIAIFMLAVALSTGMTCGKVAQCEDGKEAAHSPRAP